MKQLLTNSILIPPVRTRNTHKKDFLYNSQKQLYKFRCFNFPSMLDNLHFFY